MEKFASLEIGNEFFSTTTISPNELDEYLGFSRVKNAMFEMGTDDKSKKIVSGRAIISRLEGEFTRLRQIYGNFIILYGTDGDTNWENRQTRFLKPLYTDQVLKIKFTISDAIFSSSIKTETIIKPESSVLIESLFEKLSIAIFK